MPGQRVLDHPWLDNTSAQAVKGKLSESATVQRTVGTRRLSVSWAQESYSLRLTGGRVRIGFLGVSASVGFEAVDTA